MRLVFRVLIIYVYCHLLAMYCLQISNVRFSVMSDLKFCLLHILALHSSFESTNQISYKEVPDFRSM